MGGLRGMTVLINAGSKAVDEAFWTLEASVEFLDPRPLFLEPRLLRVGKVDIRAHPEELGKLVEKTAFAFLSTIGRERHIAGVRRVAGWRLSASLRRHEVEMLSRDSMVGQKYCR